MKKHLKIGFCGAGGTGKGTLIFKYMNSVIQGAELTVPVWSPVERIGRLFSPAAKSYKDFTKESIFQRMQYQYSILSAQIQAEKDAEKEIEGTYALSTTILCERSLFDYLAYVQDVSINSKQNYVGMARRAYYDSPYDIIFFIPYDDFKPTDEKEHEWKERDEKSRKQTNDYLHYLLFNSAEADCSHIKILKGTLEERLKQMKAVINAFR